MKNRFMLLLIVLLSSTSFYGSNAFATKYAHVSERVTITAWSGTRGSTVNIPYQTVADLCGDWDGCTLRMGMYNWDGTARTASRSNLFYYNKWNGNWRAEGGDRAGTNNNNTTQHIMRSWACYFTDGEYINWFNRGDFNTNFGLLSWNQYNATCKLTIID